uniref:E3 ubiquitin-protein ligase n=1 Tax=Schizaphis graminum TaxID=13262 RepID=A0A2S2P4I3_SCHGA
MTDFTSARQPPQQPRHPQPRPPQLRLMPAAVARPPYFDFNDIFGCSAGKKLSPPMTTASTPTPAANGGAGSATSTATTAAAAVNNNNNHSNNNNNGSSIKQQQQQQQSSAGGQQLQLSAVAAGCCPVCGTALRTAHELESHFIWELERLYKQAAAAGRRHRGGGAADKLSDGGHHNMHGLMVCSRDGGRLSPVAGGSSRDATLHGRWETYQKVKANRHNRLRIKNRKRKPDEMLLTPTPATCCCPVCNEPVAAATQEQMNAHVEMCLRNKGHPSVATAGNDDEDENVDVEGDAETSMYDIVYGGGSSGWHGQQPHNRMRQQMLMHGGGFNRGAAAVAINCSSSGNAGQQPPPRQSATGGEDSAGGAEDAVLVVDDNDNENGGSSSGSLYNKYGPNQYAERDVIVPSRPPTASSESRRLSPAELNDPSAMEAMDSCENVGPLDVSIKKENTQDEGTVKAKMDVDKYCAQFNNNGQVVEALKARIRELESASKTGSDKFTCLLCKGNFKDPVVSTSCWHVYCEVCWLQILGAKKLCPQCYVITLPSNLRRVYL